MAEVKLTHHHQYQTPAQLHDSCFGLLALSISLPTSANRPATAQERHGWDLPAFRTVQLYGTLEGPNLNLLGPVIATQRQVVSTARSMLDWPPHLLNREFEFLPSGTPG